MVNTPRNSYLICSTPRTGSTLLCALLKSTGVAGQPESYFRKQDQLRWAKAWGLGSSATGKLVFSDFVDASIAAGSSDNGVFAARIMWATMAELVNDLSKTFEYSTSSDSALLSRVFGNTRFVYIQRDDVVAQAVSLLRAEQTDLWHITGQSDSEPQQIQPHYDFTQIRQNVLELQQHNVAWCHWFRQQEIKPFFVHYEQLAASPTAVTHRVLDFLGIERPTESWGNVSNKRMSDEINLEWVQRYRIDLA